MGSGRDGFAGAAAGGAVAVVHFCQERLGVQVCCASGSGGGDGLAVAGVHGVPAGENTGQVGVGAGRFDADVAVLVQVDLALDQVGAEGLTELAGWEPAERTSMAPWERVVR